MTQPERGLKVAIVTLGCPKNQIDAETMAGLLATAGYRLTPELATAEVIIVNTCSFIQKARQESIDRILALAEQKKTGLCRRLLVTGCLTQMHHRELAAEIPEIDGFLGTGSVDKILELVAGGNQTIMAPPAQYDGRAEVGRRISTHPYGYLKVAEGCNHRCSYCVIPRLRGPLRSKERGQVVAEATRLAELGRKEILLVAQDTSEYGFDLVGRSLLPELLAELEQIPKLNWLRLLYCYPEQIDDALIDAIGQSSKVCRYLDIPLQHSHPDMLASMGRPRGHSSADLIDKLRRRLPGIALRTTFIVGYPGETAEHFQHLLDFVGETRFDHLGAFTYSREAGTRAASLGGQVPESVKRRRYHQLMSLQQRIVRAGNRRRLGQRYAVHIDSTAAGVAYGRSYREAPEIDSRIVLSTATCQAGDFVQVKITDFDDYDLMGEIVDE